MTGRGGEGNGALPPFQLGRGRGGEGKRRGGRCSPPLSARRSRNEVGDCLTQEQETGLMIEIWRVCGSRNFTLLCQVRRNQ